MTMTWLLSLCIYLLLEITKPRLFVLERGTTFTSATHVSRAQGRRTAIHAAGLPTCCLFVCFCPGNCVWGRGHNGPETLPYWISSVVMG